MTTSPVLTERQAQAMECLEGARVAGVALSTHVRSRGLDLRRIHDAIAQLRRRGIVPAAPQRVRQRPAAVAVPMRFAKVEVRPAPIPASLRLRLTLANGRCAQIELEGLGQLSRIIAALESAV